MATYNGARYLGEQLDSLAGQSRLPDELIVSDDASIDSTCAIVEQFAASAPFDVRLTRNSKNLGFNRNFEQALLLCSGELIFISDQDDVWYPDKIAKVFAAFDAALDKLVVVHDEHIKEQSTGRTFANSYFENARRLGYIDRELLSGNCTALRRILLDLMVPFPLNINYDYWIGWAADLLECRIILDEPLQLYRRHSSNSSEPVLAEDSPSHWSLFLRSGMADPRPEWRQNCHLLNAVASRIAERQQLVDGMLGKGRAQSAIARADAEIAAIEERANLLAIPKTKRWTQILRRLRGGSYDRFSGYKSAFKDMIRP